MVLFLTLFFSIGIITACSDEPKAPLSFSKKDDVTETNNSDPIDVTSEEATNKDETPRTNGPNAVVTADDSDPVVVAALFLSHIVKPAGTTVRVAEAGGIAPLLLPPERFLSDTLPSNFGLYIGVDPTGNSITEYVFVSDFDLQKYRDGKFINYPVEKAGVYQFGYRSDNQPGGYESSSLKLPLLTLSPATSTAGNAAVSLDLKVENIDKIGRLVIARTLDKAAPETLCQDNSAVRFAIPLKADQINYQIDDNDPSNLANTEYVYKACVFNNLGQLMPWTLEASAKSSASIIAINPPSGVADPTNLLSEDSFVVIANLKVAAPDYDNPAVAMDYDTVTGPICPSGSAVIAADDGSDARMTCAPVPEPAKFFATDEPNRRPKRCNAGEIITGAHWSGGETWVTCRRVNPWLLSSAQQDGILAAHNLADDFLVKVSGGYYNQTEVNDGNANIDTVVLDDDFCHCPLGMFMTSLDFASSSQDSCTHVRCLLFSKP